MPSASTKVDTSASAEPTDPFKKVLVVVDKKVRNLEKRKQKLDVIKQKKEGGATLEKDQQVAVDRYGEVITNLEFARDLQKQFASISSDAEKLLKKQAKRGKSEKQMQEMKRVREVLELQGLLDNMGSDTVRSDFQTGKHGAIVLTEENLKQLDELYKLISPTRDGDTDYLESLSEASEHIVNLLDAKEKPVVGTTYKELKELLELISNCGYFERVHGEEVKTVEKSDTAASGETEFEVVEHTDVPAADSEEVQSSLPPEVDTDADDKPEQTTSTQEKETVTPQQGVTTAEADAFFTSNVPSQQSQQAELAAAAFSQEQQQRPFQEIVSSVQGNFNFLQESTIETESKCEFSPHMDPAVVAAHPMPTQSLVRPPSTQAGDSSKLPQSGFGTATFGDQSSLNTAPTPAQPTHANKVVDPVIYSQTSQQSSVSQDYTNSAASFSHNNLSHTLQTAADNLFSTSEPTSILGKSSSDNGTITHKQYDIPPQLPMPPGHQDSNSQEGASDAEKKGMNPNATEFQSLIYNQQGEEVEAKSSETFQGGVYTNTTFNQGSRDQRGGGRGGFRGGRGGGNNRGDSRNQGNMSNGYSRGTGGNRGNYNQGYQSRNNEYRNEGGFQQNYQGGGGSGGSNYNNNGFQKRDGGGRGGMNRGGPRGGSRGGGYQSRGGSAGSGGPRGGPRGANPQGFGRPNFNQQQ